MNERLASFPVYKAYRDSGAQWFGNVPEHWAIKKLKHQANVVLGKMLCTENKGNYELKPYLKSKNIQWLTADLSSVDDMWFSPSELEMYRLRTGDLVISEGGEVGKTCMWEGELEECYIQNSAHKVSFMNGNEPRFFLYLFFLAGKIGLFEAIVNRVSIAHLTREKLANVEFLFPPVIEQKAIADFLDRKTAEIDKAGAVKEKQIALLKERKQILIQNAVTRGLNPDAPMRDSAVEWIGEIPAHWEVRRVKHLFRLVMEPSEKNNDHELLSVYSDIGVKPRRELEERGNRASTTDGYWLVRKGDIIVNKLLAWMGAIGLSNYDGVTSPAYDILRPIVPLEGDYYHLLFRTEMCSAELKKHSRGIMDMRLRLYFDKFGAVEVPYPPREEQTAIINHIDSESAKIDKAIDLQQQQIDRLKEYKATLINSAVTGKIKVSPECA